MKEKIFNLLEEPWILATSMEGQPISLNLTDIFVKAHEIKALSGEMPAQDIAILRLLLGVLYAVITRREEYKQAREDEDDVAVIPIWKALWEAKHFQAGEINAYLQKYHDRFYLIHPERPFYQIPELNKGSEYPVSKLIGDLSQSNNKIQLFGGRSGTAINSIKYEEATRWLIYINAFDDASGKPTVRGGSLPSVGPGWPGKLGLVYASGDNFFETLMLNLVLLNGDELWEDGKTTWELDCPRTSERTKISLPKNQMSLLTMQSRRINLILSGKSVIGFKAIGGDFFQEDKAFTELMTAWKQDREDKERYKPKIHDTSKQFWRDSSAIFTEDEKSRQPGIIKWLTSLAYDGAIDSRHMQIRAVSVKYAGAQRSATEDIWEDSITINASLFSTHGEAWLERIPGLLTTTDKLVNVLGFLAADIAAALGDRDGKKYISPTKEEAYFRLDGPFRTWLANIDPTSAVDMDETCKTWLNIAQGIILNLGQELISQAGTTAFIGRAGHTSPEAYNKFRRIIYSILKGKE